MHVISLHPRIFHPAHARRRRRRTLPALILALLPACAADLTVVPGLPESISLARSVGVHLEYEGGPEYVPKALRIEPGAPVTVRYSVDARIERDDLPESVVLFNPLTLLGFPTGSSTVRAVGELEIVRADRVLQSYRAAATLRQRNHLYSGDSLTSLRRSALLAVRDSLDAQLIRDIDGILSAP